MSFLQELHKPDILDCISHLSSDEVFTPPRVVNEMLDTLPQELFKSPDTKFLDPCSKSGVFLREIAKRLIDGLADKIPDLEKRLDHIFKNQLFGLAITELTALLSRRSVYCSKDASGEYSVVHFDNPEGNIEYNRTYHIWFKDKCMMCGASKSEYDRGEELETHAYSFIHTDGQRNSALFKRLKEMKFDVIIGNPPYQLSCNGGGRGSGSAIPIYHLFVQQAKKLNPRYITMIIPARWITGGRGLDNFRTEMVNDKHIKVISDYFNANECFPGIDLSGGVCYFLWDKTHTGNCKIISHLNGKESILIRPLLENDSDTFVRFNEAINILHKINNHKEPSLSNLLSSQNPYGIETNFNNFVSDACKDAVKIYAYPENGFVLKSQIPKNKEWISKYKVCISNAYGERGDFPYLVLGKPFISEPNSCSTATYMVMQLFNTEQEAKNLISYVKTKFFRFLVLLKKHTQHAARGVYQFVPLQDFNEEWTDEKLYKKYGLTQEEIDFIESMIRPMD